MSIPDLCLEIGPSCVAQTFMNDKNEMNAKYGSCLAVLDDLVIVLEVRQELVNVYFFVFHANLTSFQVLQRVRRTSLMILSQFFGGAKSKKYFFAKGCTYQYWQKNTTIRKSFHLLGGIYEFSGELMLLRWSNFPPRLSLRATAALLMLRNTFAEPPFN